MTQGVVDQALAGNAGMTSTATDIKYVYFFGGGAADAPCRAGDDNASALMPVQAGGIADWQRRMGRTGGKLADGRTS